MKLKDAIKKFGFLKRLGVPDLILTKLVNYLFSMLKGNSEIILAPLAKRENPIEILVDFDNIVVEPNKHKLNDTLYALELANRAKVGPRSRTKSWADRRNDLVKSFQNQNDKHVPVCQLKSGLGNLVPVSLEEAVSTIKTSSSSGLPLFERKSKALKPTVEHFDYFISRKDPAICFTRAAEMLKTRNVWGFPLADTIFETMFYRPLQIFERTLPWRPSLLGPDAVSESITRLINEAREYGKIIYSVDFAAFDASVLYQYIIIAFDYVKSCFRKEYATLIDAICLRFYTIGIICPTGWLRGKHGVPSGSTLTNFIDSAIQFGIACVSPFIDENKCVVQGDDGVYIMSKENIPEFERNFAYAKLKLEKSKSHISTDYAVFCQCLYHHDFRDENGRINAIYPLYRALNRIMFPERFIDFKKIGVQAKDYFAIRTLTILENCKYHPLFEELVRFVLSKEKYNLDISEDCLIKYFNATNINEFTVLGLNQQYGSKVFGIRNFEAYKLVKKILSEEESNLNDDIVVKELVV